MRALIVDDDVDRATLVAARDLAADGWFVGSASQTPSLASRSRAVRRWDRLTSLAESEERFVSGLAQLLGDGRYEVVLTTWDPAVEILSRRRAELPTVVPYGPHHGVETALDKVELSRVAASVGIDTPRMVDASREALETFAGRIVVKPAEHNSRRVRARLCAGADEALVAAREISSAGGRPLAQEEVIGELEALALVVGRNAEPITTSQVLLTYWLIPGSDGAPTTPRLRSRRMTAPTRKPSAPSQA